MLCVTGLYLSEVGTLSLSLSLSLVLHLNVSHLGITAYVKVL